MSKGPNWCSICYYNHPKRPREECRKAQEEAKQLVNACRWALGLEPLYCGQGDKDSVLRR